MDPRVARTRTSLQNALLDLARERPLDAITVADIAAEAGVNRSSFYQHYADKNQLLADALESAVDDVSSRIIRSADPRDISQPPAELTTYLQHIADNADLYRLVLGEHGSLAVAAQLRARVERIVGDAVREGAPSVFDGLPVDVVAASVTGSALGVITAWLARDPLPPIEVAIQWLWQALFGPLDRPSA